MKTVLLVEGDLTYAQVLTLLLEEDGFGVVTTPSISEGIQTGSQLRPDLIITDISSDDEEAVSLITKFSIALPRCGVIGILGALEEVGSETSNLAMSHRNVRFIRKPFPFKVLRKIVKEVVGAAEEIIATSVLLVDDDSAVCDVLARLLSSAGMTVITASHASEAIEVVRQKKIDIVVTDMMMPGVSGLDLIRKIHEIDSTIPMIAVTGELVKGPRLLREARRYGVSATLVKPFTSKELVRVVRAHAKV